MLYMSFNTLPYLIKLATIHAITTQQRRYFIKFFFKLCIMITFNKTFLS